jgi:hypothetical protein
MAGRGSATPGIRAAGAVVAGVPGYGIAVEWQLDAVASPEPRDHF